MEDGDQQPMDLPGPWAASEMEVATQIKEEQGTVAYHPPPSPPPPPPPPAEPLRSALRSRGSGPRKRKAPGEEPLRISFVETPRLRHIENFKHLIDELWYPGFMVDCDRCEQPVQWGLEGSIMGAPGRSRFAQELVLCSACLSDKSYSEIGAWMVVALAAGSGKDSGGSCNVAQAPVTELLNKLIDLCGRGDGKADLLAQILGSDAEDSDVRSAVLKKARSNVANLLSYRSFSDAALKQEQADARAASNDSDSRPRAESGHVGAKRSTAKATGTKSSGAKAAAAAVKASRGLSRGKAARGAGAPRAKATKGNSIGNGKPNAKRQRTQK